jgi:uncharacterized protein
VPPVEKYPHGALCWADLASTDIPTAGAFYAAVIGWEVRPARDPDADDDFHLFLCGGQDVAALSRPYLPGSLTGWTPYFAVNVVDAVASTAQRLGGTHLRPPHDVIGLGRTATIADPHGAVFAVWQPYTFTGSALAAEPATLHSAQLITHDPGLAVDFYAEVLGREPDTKGPAAMRAAEGETTRWHLHLAVSDHAVAAKAARHLGGTVVDVNVEKRTAELRDPAGNPVSVSEIVGR